MKTQAIQVLKRFIELNKNIAWNETAKNLLVQYENDLNKTHE